MLALERVERKLLDVMPFAADCCKSCSGVTSACFATASLKLPSGSAGVGSAAKRAPAAATSPTAQIEKRSCEVSPRGSYVGSKLGGEILFHSVLDKTAFPPPRRRKMARIPLPGRVMRPRAPGCRIEGSPILGRIPGAERWLDDADTSVTQWIAN